MKLRTKLIVSFAVVVLLVGGIGFTSSYINESVKDQVTAESKDAIKEVELAGEMGLQLFRSLTKTQYLLEAQYRQSLSTDFSKRGMSNEVVIENIDTSLQNVRQSIQETRELIEQDNKTFYSDEADTSSVLGLLEQLEKKFGIYTSLVKQLQELSKTSYADGKEFFTVTVEPYFRTNLLPLIENVRTTMQQNHQQKIAGLNSELDRVGRILGFATIFALLVAISLTYFLYRSIANPINKLARAAKSIAQGDLDERIDYDSNDELGQLSRTFNNMAESLSRTTVSRDYVDSIIESMGDLLIVVDQDYNITRINSAGLSMLQKQEEELLGRSIYDIFDDGTDPLFQIDDDNGEVQQDAALLVNNQEKLPVNVSVGSLQNRDSDPQGYVIVASDISSEKKAQKKIKQSLKEKEVLLAEIHHRVKNNLAVISGLLQMQVWEAENESAINALQQSQFRIRSIAMVHEKLYQSEDLSHIDFDQYVHELLEAVSATFLSEDSKINIHTDLDQVTLNINQAIPCSLLLNELVVNAFKHAFPDREEGGKVEIIMDRSGDQINILVRDNGIGFPDDLEQKKSLGMSLIDTLSQQISADIEFTNNDGAEVNIQFQAEAV